MHAIAMDAGGVVVAPTTGGWVWKIALKIQRNMDIVATPSKRGFLRPNRSTPKAIKVLLLSVEPIAIS